MKGRVETNLVGSLLPQVQVAPLPLPVFPIAIDLPLRLNLAIGVHGREIATAARRGGPSF